MFNRNNQGLSQSLENKVVFKYKKNSLKNYC